MEILIFLVALLNAAWGAYYVIEGLANLIYWSLFKSAPGENPLWTVGRALRVIGGVVLLMLAGALFWAG